MINENLRRCESCGQPTDNPRFCSKLCAGKWLGRVRGPIGRRKNAESGQLERWNNSPKGRANLARLHKEWSRSPKNKVHLELLNNSPEHKAQLARATKKAQEVWANSPENMAQLELARKIVQEGWDRSPENRVHLERLNHSLKHKIWAARGGRIGGRIGGKTTARIMSHNRPSWPEVRFYGLVLGDPITAQGFTAQQSDGHGIYDGAWLGQHIIAELDGGGHHAFRDRHAEDTKKDIMRMLDYNTVLREEDENVLFLKALAILGE